MSIEVLTVQDYKFCQVYVRHFGHVFEYLFIYKKKLYQRHIIVRPVWWKRWLKYPYTVKQKISTVNMLLDAAYEHIDTLKKPIHNA